MLRVHDRRRHRDLLEQHAALGGDPPRGPQRRRDDLVRRDRHRPGLRFDPRVPAGRSPGPRPQGHSRASRGHEPHARRPRLVLFACDADVRHGGDPGRDADAYGDRRGRRAEARDDARSARVPRSQGGRAGRLGEGGAVRAGRGIGRGDARRARVSRLVRAAEARGQVQGRRRRAIAVLLVLGVRRGAHRRRGHRGDPPRRRVDRARHRPRAQPPARRRPGRRLHLHGDRRGVDGGAGLPPRSPQGALAPRLQEPDDARDADHSHDARRDGRSRRAVRREGGGAGAAAAGDPRDRQRRVQRGGRPDRRSPDHRRQGVEGARSEAPGQDAAHRARAHPALHVQGTARGRIRIRPTARRDCGPALRRSADTGRWTDGNTGR